ncbi:outer membrane protein assembly factor BamE [Candidatus Fukatsuia symbiotica]|uniref:Outer membrane protein assembly factor BamE n=1 Tax=Candidatus Fukatsuia symbiotica TaxID=1878942 RepID=A0A2U8I4F5_9GAMM|nr:outer membrane protein assembly factor BamE [Candidatus Fukatsuia symbiotica]AWK14031.1 outer membrane protein assembly factor BamE [Candidatus Fukatsuia symbiotica]MEA9445614.1 outer membrane protein assembly factor BamE [Candidatus Fukatsuia symbiotica]
MCCKILCRNRLITTTLMLMILVTGCSTVEKVVYQSDINQGNYLSSTDLEKIHKGMTQQQVAYILGTPMLQDPFGTKTWFYVSRQQLGHREITQRTLTLVFDANNKLDDIKNIPI